MLCCISPSSKNPSRGFTLVELLVVVGIISVLMGVLLPALSKARSVAQTIQCAANLRSIGQALQIYAGEYKGYLPGSGFTTGRGFFVTTASTGNWTQTGPPIPSLGIPSGSPIHSLDWMGPLIRSMGIKIPDATDSSPNEGTRYSFYMGLPQFTCPSNLGTMSKMLSASTGANAGTVQATSYVTAVFFLLTADAIGGYGGLSRITPNSPSYIVQPSLYVPKISKIQNSAEKIYMADAGKYINTNAGITSPTYEIQPNVGPSLINGYACNWADFGAFTSVNSSWDRSFAPGNTRNGTIDPRPLIFRHGSPRMGSFKLNALFFDGHVDTMDDLTAANPRYWMPSGASWGLTPTGLSSGVFAKVWPDVVARYNLTSRYIAP